MDAEFIKQFQAQLSIEAQDADNYGDRPASTVLRRVAKALGRMQEQRVSAVPPDTDTLPPEAA